MGVDEPHLDHALVTLTAQCVPTACVFPAIPGDVSGAGVQRPMGRGVGHVEKERPVAVGHVVDEADRVVTDRIGVIEILRLRLDRRVVAGQGDRVVEAARTVDRSVEAIEAALAGPVVLRCGRGWRHVPLARHECVVARRAKDLGDGYASAVQFPAVPLPAAVFHHVAHARLMRIEPGEQSGSRRAASCCVVELREPQSAAGEPVEIRRGDLRTVAADVRETHVVGHDNDDVGPRAGRCGGMQT